MKRYYLYNVLFLLFISIVIIGVRQQGYLIAEIIHADPVYYVAWLPTILAIGVFGIAYQLFALDFKNIKSEYLKIFSIIVTAYIMFLGVFFAQIVLTTTFTLQLVLLGVPLIFILIHIFIVVINNVKNRK